MLEITNKALLDFEPRTGQSTHLRQEETGPKARLTEVALKALAEHGADRDGTMAAIWAEVRDDSALMDAMFNHAWRHNVGWLLAKVSRNLNKAAANGTLNRSIECLAFLAVEAQEQAQQRQETEVQERLRRERTDNDRYAYEKMVAQWGATRIGELVINGQPFFKVSVIEARTWLASQNRRLHVLDLLLSGLPHDSRPIMYYRRPEEVAALWERAQQAD